MRGVHVIGFAFNCAKDVFPQRIGGKTPATGRNVGEAGNPQVIDLTR